MALLQQLLITVDLKIFSNTIQLLIHNLPRLFRRSLEVKNSLLPLVCRRQSTDRRQVTVYAPLLSP